MDPGVELSSMSTQDYVAAPLPTKSAYQLCFVLKQGWNSVTDVSLELIM